MDSTNKLAALLEGFRGAALVRTPDGGTFTQAQGEADLANARPNRVDTRFGTASAGKAFVACAVMQLVEQGRLSLDDRLEKLVDFDLRGIDPGITLAQLLCHTSGIPDYFDEETMDDYAELFADFPNYRLRASRDLLPLFIDKPMAFAPGSRFCYNNTGYVVLGLALEKACSKPFDTVLQECVFAPAGMDGTGYFELDRLPANCATGYIRDEARGAWYSNIYSIDAKGSGAGGAFTTVGDVQRFWNALFAGKLVRPETLQTMLTPQAREEDDMAYGYGFWLAETPQGLLPFFQGQDPGVSFISSRNPASGAVIALVSNYGDNVWALHREIRAMLA